MTPCNDRWSGNVLTAGEQQPVWTFGHRTRRER